MPYENGVRISAERWRELHPVGPLFVRDADGNRTRTYAGDVELADPEAAVARVKASMEKAQTADRAAAIADALGISLDDPAMGDMNIEPGEQQDSYWITPVEHEAVDLPQPVMEVPVPPGTSSPKGHRDASEVAATRWAQDLGLPKHNPKRRSQTPVGRHSRYVRACATAWGVTDKVADSRINRHPPTCEWQQELES